MPLVLLFLLASIFVVSIFWNLTTRSHGRFRWARKWFAAFPLVLGLSLVLKPNGGPFWWHLPAWSVLPSIVWTCLAIQALILIAGALHLIWNLVTEAVLRLNSRRVPALEQHPEIGFMAISEAAGQVRPPQIYACRHPRMNLPDSSPQVFGIFRPMILVPASWLSRDLLQDNAFFADVTPAPVSIKAWRGALAHELAHIGELDGLTYLFMKAATLFVWKDWIYNHPTQTGFAPLDALLRGVFNLGAPLRSAIDRERERQEALADRSESFFDEEALQEVLRLREGAAVADHFTAISHWPIWAGVVSATAGVALSLIAIWASPGRGPLVRMLAPGRPLLGVLPLNWRLRGEASMIGRYGLIPSSADGKPARLLIYIPKELPKEHETEPWYAPGVAFGGALDPALLKDAASVEIETEIEYINLQGKPDRLPNAAQKFSLIVPSPTPSNPTLKTQVIFGGTPDLPENPEWPTATREGRAFRYISRRNLDTSTPAERMEYSFMTVFPGTYYIHQPVIRVIGRDGRVNAPASE